MNILPDRNGVDRPGIGEKCLPRDPGFAESVDVEIDGAFSRADDDVMPCAVRPVPIDGEGAPLVFDGQDLIGEPRVRH